MADDEDMGSTFLKGHMREGQDPPNNATPSGALGSKGGGTPGTDSYYAQRYGKDVDEGPSTPTVVNRQDKGARGSGTIDTDEWNENKYGASGKVKASQRNKTLKY